MRFEALALGQHLPVQFPAGVQLRSLVHDVSCTLCCAAVPPGSGVLVGAAGQHSSRGEGW